MSTDLMNAAKVRIGAVNIGYAVGGSGDWLVLIGGYASGYWQSWQRYLEPLTSRYKVLALDSRGNGASDAPDYPYTTAMMAEDTIGVMDHLGIRKAHVLGRSLGGAIAQEIALQRPDLVRSLVMTSTFARLGRRGEVLVDHWIETVARVGFPRFFEYLMTYFYTAEYYESHVAEVNKTVAGLSAIDRSVQGFAHTGHAVKSHDVLDRLGEIKAPALVLSGAEDLVTPARQAEDIARRIPGGSVRIVPRTAHGFLTEQPESFDSIVEFFSRH